MPQASPRVGVRRTRSDDVAEQDAGTGIHDERLHTGFERTREVAGLTIGYAIREIRDIRGGIHGICKGQVGKRQHVQIGTGREGRARQRLSERRQRQ